MKCLGRDFQAKVKKRSSRTNLQNTLSQMFELFLSVCRSVYLSICLSVCCLPICLSLSPSSGLSLTFCTSTPRFCRMPTRAMMTAMKQSKMTTMTEISRMVMESWSRPETEETPPTPTPRPPPGEDRPSLVPSS